MSILASISIQFANIRRFYRNVLRFPLKIAKFAHSKIMDCLLNLRNQLV